MLAMRVRVRPCRALLSPSSFGRLTSSWPSACSMVIGSTMVCISSPLGPLTCTVRPSTRTSTPEGTGIGSFPIRLMSANPSPDVGEDFPAHALLGALLVGAQTAGGGDDRDAEAAEHARQVGGLRVHPQTGLADPPDSRDRALPVRPVLQGDGQHLARTL